MVACVGHQDDAFLSQLRRASPPSASLRVVGAGHGTTGTRSLFNELCAMKFSTWHSGMVCKLGVASGPPFAIGKEGSMAFKWHSISRGPLGSAQEALALAMFARQHVLYTIDRIRETDAMAVRYLSDSLTIPCSESVWLSI